MTTTDELVQQLMSCGDRQVWTTGALVLALTGQGSDRLQTAARDVLSELGLDVPGSLGGVEREAAAARATAPVLQVASLLRGQDQTWAGQPDAALQAQGRASAQGPPVFAERLFPRLTGLLEALQLPGAQMLDVGTGVAAMAIGYAQLFPALTVVGLDVLPRALALAADRVAAAGVGNRVVLREQDVRTLDEVARYALAWLPAPFLPPPVLSAAVPRVVRSLAPGGWLILAHGKLPSDPVDAALDRLRTAAFGGTGLDDAEAEQLLREEGLRDISTAPTPEGAPSITVGRAA